MSVEQNHSYESIEASLLNKFNLVTGQEVQFEKVSITTSSPVPVGARSGGVLKNDITLGHSITFRDNASVVSAIEKVWEDKDTLFLQTSTSVYKLIQERIPEKGEKFSFEDIDHVVTEKGSVYRYLPNWTTQRFKTAENYLSDPKDVLVYIPNLDEVRGSLSEKDLKFIGTTESGYMNIMLKYIHDTEKDVHIRNRDGKIIENNKAIGDDGGQIFLTFGANGKVDFYIPVSHMPVVGFMTFDKQTNPNGSWRRHLGNKVVKILLKR